MKQAVFLITGHGEDGRAPESIIFATLNEQERDQKFAADPNRNYFSKVDRVVDLADARNKALAKLNGLDRLALFNNGTTCAVNAMHHSAPFIKPTAAKRAGQDTSWMKIASNSTNKGPTPNNVKPIQLL